MYEIKRSGGNESMKISAYKLKKGGVDPIYEIHLPEPIDSMSNYFLVRRRK